MPEPAPLTVQAEAPPVNVPTTLLFLSKIGEPEDPPSVTPCPLAVTAQ